MFLYVISVYIYLSNKAKQKIEIMKTIQAQFILESMNNGLSFELALEKSFNQVNEFLNKQLNNEEFNEKVFKCLKNV